jgi:diguanylate cyclase
MEPTEGVTTTAPSARLSAIVLLVGTPWVVLHAVGWLDPEGEITFGLLGLTAAVATAIGVYRWKPEPRWPWLTLLAAQIIALVGGGLRTVLGTLGDLTTERSLVPDLLALPAYILLAISLAGMARSALRSRDANLDAVLDAVIAALALLTLAWVYLVTPALAQADAPLSVRLVLAAYPPASMFVVAMAARMLFSSARRPPFAFRLVMLSMVGLLVGDVLYMLADTGLAEIPRTMLDVPYALAYVAFAAAVLHPSIRRVSQPVSASDDTPRLGRLVFVAAALSIPVIVLLVPAETLETTGERVVVGGIVLLLTGVASWRMFRALRQQARAQQRLVHQATHDSLTGLGNRLYVLEHLTRALGRERRTSLAVLVVDLDRFKLVNDSMGHEFGDELLLAVAERLSQSVRPGDVVARVGGDEFLAVLHGIPDEAAARDAAERTRLGFKYPLRAGEVEMVLSASVGVSFLTPEETDGVKAESLLRDADTAMSQAKDAGRDTVAVFDTSMRHRIAERLLLERELRHALAGDQLEVHYQPKVRMSDGRVTGMEALLRWTHPTLGPIRPDVFIPIAEDTGMIDEIGLWVLDEACTKLAELRSGLKQPELLTVSVNISVRQLRGDDLVDNVARTLLRHGLPGNALCLELTESMLMENVEGIRRQLEAVRSCGAKISIDDFGTGYSSLAYLRGLAIDEVKIDRAFVKDLEGSGGPGASVVSAVVAITSSMGIATVAEGVETQEQVDILRELGCVEAQGFHFGRPVPGLEIAELLERIGMASGPRLRVVNSA